MDVGHVVVRPDRLVIGALTREQGRLRLRLLDACLEQLEGAHERGDMTVPHSVAVAVRRYVRTVEPGMPIIQAIDLVMREQEQHLVTARTVPESDWGRPHGTCTSVGTQSGPSPLRVGTRELEPSTPQAGQSTITYPHSGGPHRSRRRPDTVAAGAVERSGGPFADASRTVPTMAEWDARELTERIKAAAETAGRLCSLLVEAHEGHAWSALGYPTWGEYVRTEFRLSRSRSYELLDHGRVVQALESLTGLSGIPDISPYAAGQIKPHLGEVVEAVRTRSANLPRESVAEVVVQVVREIRSRVAAERNVRRATGRIGMPNGRRRGADDDVLNMNGDRLRDGVLQLSHHIDLASLYSAVHILARMPPALDTTRLVPEKDVHRLADLTWAARWLTEFAEAWRSRIASPVDAIMTTLARADPPAC